MDDCQQVGINADKTEFLAISSSCSSVQLDSSQLIGIESISQSVF